MLDALLRLKQLTRRELHGNYQSSSFNMIVYRRFAVRRYAYGGSGIVDTVGFLLVRYATNAMLATAAKAALRVDVGQLREPFHICRLINLLLLLLRNGKG